MINRKDIIGLYYDPDDEAYKIVDGEDIVLSDLEGSLKKIKEETLETAFLYETNDVEDAIAWFIPGLIDSDSLCTYLYNNTDKLVVLHRDINIQLESSCKPACSLVETTAEVLTKTPINKSSKKKLLI